MGRAVTKNGWFGLRRVAHPTFYQCLLASPGSSRCSCQPFETLTPLPPVLLFQQRRLLRHSQKLLRHDWSSATRPTPCPPLLNDKTFKSMHGVKAIVVPLKHTSASPPCLRLAMSLALLRRGRAPPNGSKTLRSSPTPSQEDCQHQSFLAIVVSSVRASTDPIVAQSPHHHASAAY